MAEKILRAIRLTQEGLRERSSATWIVAFSGGKDSTALLKILCAALRGVPEFRGQVHVVYCDTGVENPVLDEYVVRLMERVRDELSRLNLPISVNVIRAPVEKRFFVKIAGRGYPPPTNAFRWCTKDLRILPVSDFIDRVALQGDVVVALGSRLDESEQRRRSIDRFGGGHWQTQREAKRKYDIFLPLLDFDLGAVWDAVFSLGVPDSINAAELEKLYRGASGECPIIKHVQANPCAKVRFGCWTCTVVRKDKSAENLIAEGHSLLLPYLNVRNWLSEYRNDLSTRWPIRRSGVNAPGPFTLKARIKILNVLRDLEATTGRFQLAPDELGAMRRLMLDDLDKEREIFGRASASHRGILKATRVRPRHVE